MWRGTGNGGTDLTSAHGPGSVGVSPWQSSEVVSRAAAREMSGGGGGGARLEGEEERRRNWRGGSRGGAARPAFVRINKDQLGMPEGELELEHAALSVLYVAHAGSPGTSMLPSSSR